MLLVDAVKDLLNHVCSGAEKTAISEAVNYFTSHISQTRDRTILTDSSTRETHCADDRMIANIAEKPTTADTCTRDQSTCAKDCPSVLSCQDDEIDVEDGEVAAADDHQPVTGATKAECRWKLLIKVRSRTKGMPYRYCSLLCLQTFVTCYRPTKHSVDYFGKSCQSLMSYVWLLL